MPASSAGTIAYNNGQYDEALASLLEARKGYAQRSAQPRDLYFLIGDSLARLERYQEAEPYLKEEIRLYPQHVRARAGLAMLYQAMGRDQRRPSARWTISCVDVPSREADGHRGARVADVRPPGRGRGCRRDVAEAR